MADSSPLAELIDRAQQVFDTAGELGRQFQVEHDEQRRRGSSTSLLEASREQVRRLLSRTCGD